MDFWPLGPSPRCRGVDLESNALIVVEIGDPPTQPSSRNENLSFIQSLREVWSKYDFLQEFQLSGIPWCYLQLFRVTPRPTVHLHFCKKAIGAEMLTTDIDSQSQASNRFSPILDLRLSPIPHLWFSPILDPRFWPIPDPRSSSQSYEKCFSVKTAPFILN